MIETCEDIHIISKGLPERSCPIVLLSTSISLTPVNAFMFHSKMALPSLIAKCSRESYKKSALRFVDLSRTAIYFSSALSHSQPHLSRPLYTSPSGTSMIPVRCRIHTEKKRYATKTDRGDGRRRKVERPGGAGEEEAEEVSLSRGAKLGLLFSGLVVAGVGVWKTQCVHDSLVECVANRTITSSCDDLHHPRWAASKTLHDKGYLTANANARARKGKRQEEGVGNGGGDGREKRKGEGEERKDLCIPRRHGKRPTTILGYPHLQVSHHPHSQFSLALQEKLFTSFLNINTVDQRLVVKKKEDDKVEGSLKEEGIQERIDGEAAEEKDDGKQIGEETKEKREMEEEREDQKEEEREDQEEEEEEEEEERGNAGGAVVVDGESMFEKHSRAMLLQLSPSRGVDDADDAREGGESLEWRVMILSRIPLVRGWKVAQERKPCVGMILEPIHTRTHV